MRDFTQDSFANLLAKLRSKWGREGSGARPEDIEAFERRYRIALPVDVRAYFEVVNGTHHGSFMMEDPDELIDSAVSSPTPAG